MDGGFSRYQPGRRHPPARSNKDPGPGRLGQPERQLAFDRVPQGRHLLLPVGEHRAPGADHARQDRGGDLHLREERLLAQGRFRLQRRSRGRGAGRLSRHLHRVHRGAAARHHRRAQRDRRSAPAAGQFPPPRCRVREGDPRALERDRAAAAVLMDLPLSSRRQRRGRRRRLRRRVSEGSQQDQPKACGCGKPETDSDSDGIPDCIEPIVQERPEQLDPRRVRLRAASPQRRRNALPGREMSDSPGHAADLQRRRRLRQPEHVHAGRSERELQAAPAQRQAVLVLPGSRDLDDCGRELPGDSQSIARPRQHPRGERLRPEPGWRTLVDGRERAGLAGQLALGLALDQQRRSVLDRRAGRQPCRQPLHALGGRPARSGADVRDAGSAGLLEREGLHADRGLHLRGTDPDAAAGGAAARLRQVLPGALLPDDR